MKLISMSRTLLACATFAITTFAGSQEGQAVFTAKCQSCHGPNGEGKDAIAKMLKVTMNPLSSKEVQAKSDADLKKVVTSGQGTMKPISGLSDAQIADVVAFVRTLKK